MKRLITSILLVCLTLLLPGGLPSSGSAAEPHAEYMHAKFGRALSLRVLFEQLEPYHASGNYPDQLAHLAGITRIYGYVVDEENRDVILFGESDADQPPLHLEDFVIALKNAWYQYSRKEGNTHYYSYPGCSIDPLESTLQKLKQLEKKIMQSQNPAEVERAIESWHQLCRSPQKVRVMGVPFKTRFAKTMVTADYDMKRLADGTDSLQLAGFASLSDMTLEEVKQAILENRAVSVPISTTDRFWFYPGQNVYDETQGAMVIRQCPVILLTEAEYLNASGNLVGSGQVNPLAHQFAQAFTARYADVAQLRPQYRELENLFRWVALAKIMENRRPHQAVGLNIDDLLERFRIREESLKPTLPGRSHVKRYEHRQDYEGGYSIAQLWLPSCGGVEIRISMQNAIIEHPISGDIVNQKIEVRKKSNGRTLTWDVPLMIEIRRQPQEGKNREFVQITPKTSALN